jgi:ubiquinone/menaquinone biosynthesis C-methylase UbiE
MEQMFRRQAARAREQAAWLDRLGLRRGDRCIDMGSGPGYFSLLLAERVGADGVVYAIDPSTEALAYLAREQAARGVANIRRIQSDGATAELPDGPADAALVAMMLHHAGDPAAVLRNVGRLLRPGGRALVAEFHPEGTGRHGPALTRRIAPEAVRAWCEAAGLSILAEDRPTPEHYVLACCRD